MRYIALLLAFGAITFAPQSLASGVLVRCSPDLESAMEEPSFGKETHSNPEVMEAEKYFLMTASLEEIEARNWQKRSEKQKGAYSVKVFQGHGFAHPPEVSDPFVSDREGMWCVSISRKVLRNVATLTLDIDGNIIERDLIRVIVLGNE